MNNFFVPLRKILSTKKSMNMKKNLFLILILFGSLTQALPQAEIWGVTFEGGNDNGGILFTNNMNGDDFQMLHSFDRCVGEKPQLTTLCEAENEKLYGLTSLGGAYNGGVLFEFDPVLQSYQIMFEFDLANGGFNPMGSLMAASNGKLYGMCSMGGTNAKGTIFEFDLENNFLEI